MAGTVMPSPLFVGLDNSGNPLSGGKLHTYSPGGTSNLATYSDAALSSANANPVVLDAGGRAPVWARMRWGTTPRRIRVARPAR